MPIEPINTVAIQQFIKQVHGADISKSKELRMDIVAAKNLAFTLGIVMARLNGELEQFVKEHANASNEIIEVRIGEAGNWNNR